MKRYKDFLYTRKSMPRSTFYKHRQKQRQEERLGGPRVVILGECEDVPIDLGPSEEQREDDSSKMETSSEAQFHVDETLCQLRIPVSSEIRCTAVGLAVEPQTVSENLHSQSGMKAPAENQSINAPLINEHYFSSSDSSDSHTSLRNADHSNAKQRKRARKSRKSRKRTAYNNTIQEAELSSSSSSILSELEEDSPRTNSESPSCAEDNLCFSGDEDCLADDLTSNSTGKNERNSQTFDKLCQCTTKTAGDVLFMCLALSVRHNFTWDAQLDIFKMINCIFGKTVLRPNKYSYFKSLALAAEKGNARMLLFCPLCYDLLDENTGDGHGFVMCPHCKIPVKLSDPCNYFASVSMESQICELLKDPEVSKLMVSYRFERKKIRPNALEDVYDGAAYKKLCEPNEPLSSPFNFSYSFNTDGVKFAVSSKRTLWPIYVTLLELPPELRNRHVILAGLYVGPNEPNHQIFLKPFVEEANKLSTEGIFWLYKGEKVNSKFFPLLAVADSVARCQILNMQSFGGKYGCTFCYQKSERTIRGQRFPIPDIEPEKRTEESHRLDILAASTMQSLPDIADRHYRGVKGPCALSFHLFFSLFLGFVVDYMHAVLLGVIKTHTDLILQPMRKKCWIGMEEDRIGMEHLQKAIDKRLMKIKPPSSISRAPRSIVDYKSWKASEWRSWLLFYAVPCLDGLIKKKHLAHIAMLSAATNLLLQKSVSAEDVDHAKRLFQSYTFFFQKYFGEEYMVYNVHLLSHIADGVLNWGPLWTHNAFPYEGDNHFLLKLCRNAATIVQEAVNKFLIYSSMPRLSFSLPSSKDSVEFCDTILNKRLQRVVRCSDCVLLGCGDLPSFTTAEQDCVERANINWQESLVYQRFLYKGMRLSTLQYSANKKKCDAFFMISSSKMVKINAILKTDDSVHLLVQEIKLDKSPILRADKFIVSHIKKVESYGELLIVPPWKIKHQCIVIDLSVCGLFVAAIPFGCSGD